MKYGLPEKTIDQIKTALSGFEELEKAVLYGSRAKGTFKNGSDIDLTLYGSNLTPNILSRIENRLDELLLPYQIDLSLFEKIDNPDLIDHIQRVGIVFYKKARA